MGDIFDDIFAGGAGQAAEAQQAGLKEALEATERARQEALQEMRPRFQQAGDTRRAGYQAGFDTLARMNPIQAAMTQAGNVSAQGSIQQGQQQAMNALLGGGPVDMSAMNPVQFGYDPSMFSAPNVNDALSGESAYGVQPPDIGVPPPTNTTGGYGGSGDSGGGGYGGGNGSDSGIYTQIPKNSGAAIDDYISQLLGGYLGQLGYNPGGASGGINIPMTNNQKSYTGTSIAAEQKDRVKSGYAYRGKK